MIEIAASAFAVVPPEATSLPRSVIVILPSVAKINEKMKNENEK